jgi:hypothetical protein
MVAISDGTISIRCCTRKIKRAAAGSLIVTVTVLVHPVISSVTTRVCVVGVKLLKVNCALFAPVTTGIASKV